MIIRENTELGNKTEIRNSKGNILSHVISFDTETKEAEMYGMLFYRNKEKESKVIAGINVTPQQRGTSTFICHLPDHKAYNIKTGEEIK